MATLLSRILPNDISIYIFKIAISSSANQLIIIYTYNLYLIIEKHLYNIQNIDYNCQFLEFCLIPDLNHIINAITHLNNYLIPYKKFNSEICYDKNFKLLIKNWLFNINKKNIIHKNLESIIINKFELLSKLIN